MPGMSKSTSCSSAIVHRRLRRLAGPVGMRSSDFLFMTPAVGQRRVDGTHISNHVWSLASASARQRGSIPRWGPGFLPPRGRSRRTQQRLKPSAHLSHSLPSTARAPLCMRPGDLSCSSSLCPRPMADAVRLLNPLADLWCSGSSRHSGCRGRSILVLCLRATGHMSTSMSMTMTMTMTTMAMTRSMTGLWL